MKHVILIFLLYVLVQPAAVFAAGGPRATVREVRTVYKTYPFSDPNPIAVRGKIYPYFRTGPKTRHGMSWCWKMIMWLSPSCRRSEARCGALRIKRQASHIFMTTTWSSSAIFPCADPGRAEASSLITEWWGTALRLHIRWII